MSHQNLSELLRIKMGLLAVSVLVTAVMGTTLPAMASEDDPADMMDSQAEMVETSAEPVMQMDAGSSRLPAGLKLRVRFVTGIDAAKAQPGDVFVAMMAEDTWADKQLILPKGSVVRGRVEAAERARLFSKGALLRLAFDHVVLPTGELEPLNLSMDLSNPKLNREKNALYTDPGVGSKLNTSVDKGVETFQTFHEKGIAEGKKRGGGLNMLLTVPTNTVAGVATGTAITAVESAKALFGKGEAVVIQPGEEMTLELSGSASLQGQ